MPFQISSYLKSKVRIGHMAKENEEDELSKIRVDDIGWKLFSDVCPVGPPVTGVDGD